MAEFDKVAALRNSGTADFGQIFVRDAKGADAFSKLSRYETTIERSLYKALHELQRRQAARGGRPGVPPVAVDVELPATPGEAA